MIAGTHTTSQWPNQHINSQVVIMMDEEDDPDDGDEEEQEYEEGVYDEDNNLGEEEDPTYKPGRRAAPVWNGEHFGTREDLDLKSKAKGCEEAMEKCVKSKEKMGQFWNFANVRLCKVNS